MADPETPTPSLAERLVTEAGILSNLGYPGRVNETINLLSEVAVRVLYMEAQLRQLDRIKAAAGDDIEWSVALAVCRELAVRYPSWASDLNITEALLRRLDDALEADDGA